MQSNGIGIVSPGDMGHSIGQVLGEHGVRVLACLNGRSRRTQVLAGEAKICTVESYDELVRSTSMILSIVVPGQAWRAAEDISAAIARTSMPVLYVDCNAISPTQVGDIAQLIQAAGGRFADASIIGPPPRNGGNPTLLVSGSDTEPVERLRSHGIEVKQIGGEIGLASAAKMCFAGIPKAFIALWAEILTAADILGVWEILLQQVQYRLPDWSKYMREALPSMLPKSKRWVTEMEEIARTLEMVGLTPKMLEGSAEVYRMVSQSRLSNRTIESDMPMPSLKAMIKDLCTLAGSSKEDHISCQ